MNGRVEGNLWTEIVTGKIETTSGKDVWFSNLKERDNVYDSGITFRFSFNIKIGL